MQLFAQTIQIPLYHLLFQTNVHSSEAVAQERLSRLESDKECLILQVREQSSLSRLQNSRAICLACAIKCYCGY